MKEFLGDSNNVNEERNDNLKNMCDNICSLSQLPVWKSTGIFERIFSPNYDAKNTKFDEAPDTSTVASTTEISTRNENVFTMVDIVANSESYNSICQDYCKL